LFSTHSFTIVPVMEYILFLPPFVTLLFILLICCWPCPLPVCWYPVVFVVVLYSILFDAGLYDFTFLRCHCTPLHGDLHSIASGACWSNRYSPLQAEVPEPILFCSSQYSTLLLFWSDGLWFHCDWLILFCSVSHLFWYIACCSAVTLLWWAYGSW
jgi:hypothetical protein